MTVVACYYSDEVAAIMTDAMVVMRDNTSSHLDCALRQKIERVEHIDAWITLVGDTSVLLAVNVVASWYVHKERQLDIHDDEFWRHVIAAASRYPRARRSVFPDMVASQDADMYIMHKGSIFRWSVAYIETTDSFAARDKPTPTRMTKDMIHVQYGQFCSSLEAKIEPSNCVTRIENCIKEHHRVAEIEGRRLPYELNNRFCGVIYDRSQGSPAILEIIPFRYLSDAIAGLDGGPRNWTLMSDRNYRWSPF